ncbi:GNAT family N-acetyltransferase [Rhodococcus chondri]|uniref:GNAT family N-acetyltransferase n=1 Tax=Rhodococcus chondri TaxID=3065941 RepID=A0ABU7JNM5_9NOCA|nr:GNAT family N-acetyltransferase [Rhodococcus sp. CC-R104]MEE2031636.1 GNAT family N-acetyltransferase [Rhodococcus sp. CC-R104]
MTSPAPRDIWNQIARSDPLAGPSQVPEWLDCACHAEGWTDASRLYELSSGRRVVAPMVRRTLVPIGGLPALFDTYASMPRGWSVGGIVAPGGATAEDVMAVVPDLASTPGARILIRPDFSAAPVWVDALPRTFCSSPRRCSETRQPTYILDLDGGFEEVWKKRFGSKARSGIRNAQRKSEAAGLVIECGSSPQLVHDFYDVYLRWLDRRAYERHTPRAVARWAGCRREPFRRFETVARVFGDRSRIWVAYLDGVPVAAAYAVYHGAIGMGWRAFSDRALAGTLRTHELLQVRAVEHACLLGCRYFDMGPTGGVAGLEHVKRRFGGVAHHAPEFAWEQIPLSRIGQGFIRVRRRVELATLALPSLRSGQKS